MNQRFFRRFIRMEKQVVKIRHLSLIRIPTRPGSISRLGALPNDLFRTLRSVKLHTYLTCVLHTTGINSVEWALQGERSFFGMLFFFPPAKLCLQQAKQVSMQVKKPCSTCMKLIFFYPCSVFRVHGWSYSYGDVSKVLCVHLIWCRLCLRCGTLPNSHQVEIFTQNDVKFRVFSLLMTSTAFVRQGL